MEPSERGRVCSSGDGVASSGDIGDIMGALTGRVDLLSGVDAMTGVEECKDNDNLKTKLNKFNVLMWYLQLLIIFKALMLSEG